MPPERWSARIVRSDGGEKRVVVDRDRKRVEPAGGRTYLVYRRDLGACLEIEPARRRYQVSPFDFDPPLMEAARDDREAPGGETWVGEDVIDGVTCDRFEFRATVMSVPDLLWIDRATGLERRRLGHRLDGAPGIRIDWLDVSLDAAPPGTFEVPQGFSRVPDGGWLAYRSATRPAVEADRAAIEEVGVAAGREMMIAARGTWAEQREREQIRRQLDIGSTVVVELDARVVAFRMMAIEEGVPVIHSVYVHPDAQASGIGTWLVREALDAAALAGASVELSVLHVNPRARALYERLGFVAIGSDDLRVRMRRAGMRLPGWDLPSRT